MSLLTRVMSHPATWLVWICPVVIVSPLGAQITVTELQSPYSFVNDPIEKNYFISSVNGEADAADNNGFITKLNPNGKLLNLKFIQGGKDDVTLHAPKGMAWWNTCSTWPISTPCAALTRPPVSRSW